MERLIGLDDVKQYASLDLLAKQVVQGYIVGLHKSPLHGFSVEFAEHRLYQQGEDIKNVDWKVFARTDKMFVKKFEEETNLRCQIVMDISSSMYYPDPNRNKLHFATYSSAALAYVLKKQRDAVGLTLFNDKIRDHFPARSSSKHHRMLMTMLHQTLERPMGEKKTKLTSALHQVAEALPKRSLVVIFSDMLQNQADEEKLFDSLQHLRHNKHEVILFHVVDKQKEIKLNFENRPYKFVDMETNEEIKVQPKLVQEEYNERVRQYFKALKTKCGSYKIEFVEVDINEPFAQVLIPFFIKRSKMF